VDVAISALRNASHDLKSKSWIHTITNDPIITEVGVGLYDLDPVNGYKNVGVASVYYDSLKLYPMSEQVNYSGHINPDTAVGPAARYYLPNDSSLQLSPAPDRIGQLSVRVALAPSRVANGIEDFVYNQFFEYI